MIRHVPAGRGHPYLIDPEKRVPLRPVAGESFELRATAPNNVDALELELVREGHTERVDAKRRGPALADVDPRWGRTAGAGAGDLTDTARPPEQEGRTSWAVELPGLPAGTELAYRFDGGEWFELTVCDWRPAGGALTLDAPVGISERLVPGSVECLGDGELSYRLRFSLRLRPGEHVVGFGERFDALDQSGCLVDTAVFDQYKGQGARSYLPAPFAIVVGGDFGFHVDTGRRCFFDVGASDPELLRVEVDLEPGETDPSITLRLHAGEPTDVLRSYWERAGVPASPPPDWVYRLWLSGNDWASQQRVLAEVDQAAEQRIPAGVVVIEAWSDEQTFVAFNGARYEPHLDGAPHRLADFDFPADGLWPDPKGLVEQLHDRDLKVLLWQIPLVVEGEGEQLAFDRRTMVERGYCVREADGSPYRNRGGWFERALLLDPTNPEAVDWWIAKRRYLVEEVGVDGFKTDGGEHAWGAELVYADGSRGGETTNRYPVLYTAAYQRLLRECGREPVTFSRAGFTGSSAYPCHWAGDADSTWQAFRASITAGLTAGLAGITYWGWDIAGFSGSLPTVELYLRATAMAALCPIMQLHSEHGSPERTPWQMAEATGDSRCLTVFRRFALLRERLVPYLAEQGTRSLRERTPLMRALCLDHPSDERVWEFPYQYMLGDALLVAPVCEEGAASWRSYLPAGDWVDVWDGEHHSGGCIVESDAPLERIPVFCAGARADELIPLFSAPADTLQEVTI